jgi:hypothetical protein
MLPVVTSARSPMLRVAPVMLLTKRLSQRVQLLCTSRRSGHEAPSLSTHRSGQCHQTLLVRNERIRPDKNAFNPAEHGGVGADAERKT